MYNISWNKRKRLLNALAVGALLLAGGAGRASAAADPTTCKRAIARASATFERTKLRALQGCEDLKRKGKLPATTDCLTETKTSAKIAKASTSFSSTIGKGCTGLSLTQIGWDGSGNAGNPVLAKACSAGKRPGNLCGRETECPGICVGGGKDDESCTFNSSCQLHVCVKANCIGGTQNGVDCSSLAAATACQAGGGVCNWGNGCDGGSSSSLGVCVGGTSPNKACFADSDCSGGGVCDSGCNTGNRLDCQSGACNGALCGTNKDCGFCAALTPNQNQSCAADADCGKVCTGGSRNGQPCKVLATDCPGGGTACAAIAGGCHTGTCSGGFCQSGSGLLTAGFARPSAGFCAPVDRCPSFENNQLLNVKTCDGDAVHNGAFCSSTADCGAGLCKNGCDFALSSVTDVVSCLECVGESSVDQINSAVYGQLKPTTYTCFGGTNSGLPCTPATATTDCPGGKCQSPTADKSLELCKQGIGKAAAKFFDTKRAALAVCEDSIINAGSGTCPDSKATAKISAASAKLLSDIAKVCAGKDKAFGGSGAANLDFAPDAIGNTFSCANFTDPNGGPNCSGPINTLQDLANCIQCVTEFKVDCTDRIAAPQVGTTAQPVFAQCNPTCGNSKIDGRCSVTTGTNCFSTLDCPSGESCIPIETCDDGNAVSGDTCPSNCFIHSCSASATTHFMLISSNAPAGVELGAMAVYVEYPDGTVGIPGSGNDAQVQGSLTVPFDAFSSINDLEYAVRIALIGNGGAMFPGVVAVVQVDQCTGASDPTNDQFRCSVESAADTNGNTVAGASCSVTVF
ncbi:MAG: hypothetical protein HY270_07770 [Deltaproteobacteria bacterium]|nr:hypothetical protein [Deltaproteobacteria bacterium]